MTVPFVPEGHPCVSPYLIVKDAPGLIVFLERVLGAILILRHDTPDGSVMHAEVRIGDSVIMIGETGGPWTPTPATLHVYVEDVDTAYARALEAGATSVAEPVDKPYGDRNGGVKDPAGNTWWLSTHVKDVSEEELARRVAAAT